LKYPLFFTLSSSSSSSSLFSFGEREKEGGEREEGEEGGEREEGEGEVLPLEQDPVLVPNDEDFTPCHFAALFTQPLNASGIISALFQTHKTSDRWAARRYIYLTKGDSENRTPLHLACKEGNVEAVVAILAMLPHLSCVSRSQSSQWNEEDDEEEDDDDVVSKRSVDDMKTEVLEAGDSEGRTALHLACLYGRKKIVSLLLSEGSDFRKRDDNGLTLCHLAAINAHADVVRLIVKKGQEHEMNFLKREDYAGRTPLHCAAQSNRGELSVECLRYIIEEEGANVDCLDHQKRSPLFYSCSCPFGEHSLFHQQQERMILDEDYEEEVQFGRGGGIQQFGFEEEFPSFEESNHLAVSYLISCGANCFLFDKAGRSCLHYACYGHDLPIVKVLSEAIEEKELSEPESSSTVSLFHSPDHRQMTPLHAACSRETKATPDLITELIDKYGMELEAKEERGMTPLLVACAKGHEKVVETLVNFDANIHVQENKGCTCLMLAATTPCASTLSILRPAARYSPTGASSSTSPLLLPTPDRLSFPQFYMLQALAESLSVGDEELQKLIKMKDDKGRTVFHHLACAPCSLYSDILPCFDLLEKRLATPQDALELLEQPDKNEWRPCHVASKECNTELLSYLEKKGADLTVPTSSGSTCLHLAAASDNLKTVKWCIEHSHDPFALDYSKMSALHIAAACGCTAVCEYLIKKFPEMVDQPDKEGRLPLHYGIMSYAPERAMDPTDIIDLVKVFADSGRHGQFRACMKNGASAVHLGCLMGLSGVVSLVLSYILSSSSSSSSSSSCGEGWRVRDNCGLSPLHYAAITSPDQMTEDTTHLDELFRVQKQFPSLFLPDKKKRTPMHLAAFYSNHIVLSYLIKHSPSWIDCPDVAGWLPIHTAAKFGTRPVTAALASASPKTLMTRTKGGKLPIHICAERGNSSILTALLKSSPKESSCAEALDREDRSPLHISCAQVNVACIKALVGASKGVINVKDKTGKTPLFSVLAKGESVRTPTVVTMVQQLLANGADLAIKTEATPSQPAETSLEFAERHRVAKEVLRLLGKKDDGDSGVASPSRTSRMRTWARRGDQAATASTRPGGGLEVAAAMSRQVGLRYRQKPQ